MALDNKFWQSYSVSEEDLDSIYNFLLETERPLDKHSITKFIIDRVIKEQEELHKKEKLQGGRQYTPGQRYAKGDVLVFPQMNWKSGKVVSVRNGKNPEFPELEVIDVQMGTKETLSFAANLAHHKLNEPVLEIKDPLLDTEYVISNYGQMLAEKVTGVLSNNKDVVCIARQYFPRALVVDIGIGHLNLCEAVLEMAQGGPLTTADLIEQVELPTDVNTALTEFSLNLALAEDGRFDEVGPAGVTMWFLKRLEPAEVQAPPVTLKYTGEVLDPVQVEAETQLTSLGVCDELEPTNECEPSDSVSISLSYPHWRAGTIPLNNQLKDFFPTAYETPRVKFNFRDGNSKDIFSGWVVRPGKYIFGLRNWYEQMGTIPGSIVTISRSEVPGEVIVRTTKNKNSKDWIRTVLVGADGGIVFALLKQVISCTYDDRMAIMVPDVAAIDAIWTNSTKQRQPVEKVILNMMRELGKLNPQGQIHAQELYAAVNVVKRTPPSVILKTLSIEPWAKHLGDLYFRLDEGN